MYNEKGILHFKRTEKRNEPAKLFSQKLPLFWHRNSLTVSKISISFPVEHFPINFCWEAPSQNATDKSKQNNLVMTAVNATQWVLPKFAKNIKFEFLPPICRLRIAPKSPSLWRVCRAPTLNLQSKTRLCRKKSSHTIGKSSTCQKLLRVLY